MESAFDLKTLPSVNHHPNVHAPWSKWSNEETLHVAVAYSNPLRWHSRRKLMNDFRLHMAGFPNVHLHVGELAYGDRPHEVTGEHAGDVQLRTHSVLFHKENILNRVVATFPPNWKYGCYWDADFSCTRHDWALEAVHQLQHSPWVQLFSSYVSMSARTCGGTTASAANKSFAATFIGNGHQLPPNGGDYEAGWDYRSKYLPSTVPPGPKPPWVPVGATGGAWAFTREAFDAVGGLLDCCILGHADWFMAFGMVSQPTRGIIAQSKFHPHYTAKVAGWQERATAECKANISVVDQLAVHHYHGALVKRGYETRDQILVKHKFDPLTDIRRNWQGIYELTGNKPGLRDAILRYFLSREEDSQ